MQVMFLRSTEIFGDPAEARALRSNSFSSTGTKASGQPTF